jgi:hypothetical protein
VFSTIWVEVSVVVICSIRVLITSVISLLLVCPGWKTLVALLDDLKHRNEVLFNG